MTESVHCLFTAAGIEAITHNNIYGLVDNLSDNLSKYMPSYEEEVVTGTAEIKALFPSPRGGDDGSTYPVFPTGISSQPPSHAIFLFL